MENIGDKEGENTAALCAIVFVVSSKTHRRGVRSATYASILWSKNDFYMQNAFFSLQTKSKELQMVFSQKCEFRKPKGQARSRKKGQKVTKLTILKSKISR